MRVIAGKFRGRPLEAPAGTTTRPMMDRVKESLFDALGSRFGTPGTLPAIDVLDLFSGSGALGIECMSRGARSCLFVERDRRSLRVLRANLQSLGLDESCRVSNENGWTMRVPKLGADGLGLVFVDPPYRDVEKPTRARDLLERLAPRLAQNGWLVFRCSSTAAFPADTVRGLECADLRAFGRMRVLLFRRAKEATVFPRESPSS